MPLQIFLKFPKIVSSLWENLLSRNSCGQQFYYRKVHVSSWFWLGSARREPDWTKTSKRNWGLLFRRPDSSTAQIVLVVISYVFSFLGLQLPLMLGTRFCNGVSVGDLQPHCESLCCVHCLVFFSIKRGKEGLLIFALYAQLILDLKKSKTWLLFLLLQPCTARVGAQPYMQLIQPPAQLKRKKIWEGENQMGVGLSKEICFTRFTTVFLVPHSGGFCLLTHGQRQVKRLCVHA